MTADVTHLPQQVEHFPSCDRDMYGRAVVWLMEGSAELITRANVLAFVEGYRKTEPCGCLSLRLNKTESDLIQAKLAFNACMSEANAERVAGLVADVRRLRGMA